MNETVSLLFYVHGSPKSTNSLFIGTLISKLVNQKTNESMNKPFCCVYDHSIPNNNNNNNNNFTNNKKNRDESLENES